MSNLRRFIESQTKGYRNNTEEEKRIGTVPDATVQYEAVQPVAQKSNLTRYVEQEAAKARASISSGLPSVQTAGEVSPAVSYAEKLSEEKKNQPTQKYGLIDGKVVLPSFIENQGLYAAPGTEKSKVNYLMESAAKGLVGGALQAGEAVWQDLSGDAGKAERAYYDYVTESAYNPQKAGQMGEYLQQMQTARENEKLDTDTLGYKLLESSQQDMAKATEGMGRTGQFLTGVVGSTLQNAYLIPLAVINPAASAAVMAMSAAGRSAKEQSDRGRSLDRAVARGAVDGSIEYFTELMGMDAVADLLVGQGENIVKNVFRSVVSEAGEEGLSYLAGYIADKLEKDPEAKFSIQELLQNMLAGGLSGGLLSGGGAAIGGIANTMATTQQTQTATKPGEAGVVTLPAPQVQPDAETNAVPQTDDVKEHADSKELLDKLRVSIPDLSGESISYVKGDEFPKSNISIVEQVGQFFKSLGNKVSRVGFGDIIINERTVKDDIAHGIGRAKSATFKAVPDILAKGKQIDYQPNWKGRGYDSYVFAGQIDYAGKPAYVATVVTKGDDNRFYLHEVLDENGNIIFTKKETGLIKTGVTAQSGVTGEPASSNIIAQNNQNMQEAGVESQPSAKDINVPGKDVTDINVGNRVVMSMEDAKQQVRNIGADAVQQEAIKAEAVNRGLGETIEQIEAFAKRTGVNVHYYNGQLGQKHLGFREGNDIYIDLRDKNVMLKTAVHETIHALRSNNSKAYEKLYRQIDALQKNSTRFNVLAEMTGERYADMGVVDTEANSEEIVAKLSEYIIENPEEFLRKFGKEKTFVDAVIDFLKEIKNTIVAKFGGDKAEAARVDNALMALEQYLRNEVGETETGDSQFAIFLDDKGKEREYNIKWATDSKILAKNELANLSEKLQNKAGYKQVSDGKIVAVGEEYGINNKLLFFRDYTTFSELEKIVVVWSDEETIIGPIRREIYGKSTSVYSNSTQNVYAYYPDVNIREYRNKNSKHFQKDRSRFEKIRSTRRQDNRDFEIIRNGERDSGENRKTVDRDTPQGVSSSFTENTDGSVTNSSGDVVAVKQSENDTQSSIDIGEEKGTGKYQGKSIREISEGTISESQQKRAKAQALLEERQRKTAKLVPEKFAREQAKKAEDGLPESVGAMKSGYYAAIEEYGAFPEGEKATNPVDVPMSVDGKHGVTRGVRTIMEAAATAEDMLNDFEKAVADGAFNYDINRDKPAVEKAVAYIEKYGFEQTLNEWNRKIAEHEAMTKDDMAKAQIMYASAVAEGDYETAMHLATDISIEATRAGQVVQAMRLLKKTTPEGRLYHTQRSIEAIQEEINDKYGDKSVTIEVPQGMKDAIKNAHTSEELQKATEVMHMHIAKQLPFSWTNFINSWRYLAMLGNTRTQWRNVLSNCVSGIAQEWTNFVQTAGETVITKAGGNIERTSAIKTTEWQRKQAEADFKAIEKDLYSKGKYRNDTLNAIQKMQNPFDFKGKGGKAGEIVGKGLTWWNDKTNRAMETGDRWFSAPAYKRYYARYLAANKINSEEQLTNKVKLRARAWATKQANESVFRESNALAEWIGQQEAQLLKSTKPGRKTAATLVGGLMPFRNTPLNITKRAFEYTPVGIATELGWQAISNKKYGTDYNTTKLINKAAKSFSGTVLIALGYALAKHGILTGGLGDDKEDKMKKQMGQQEYALNTDNWSMTMDWAGAGVMPLFVGAQMYQMTEEESDGFFMAMLDTLANASAPVMETSMMTGLMSAIKDAKYEDDITKAGMTFLASGLGSYIGQFVPTILGQFSRAIDDTSRTAYTNTKGVIRPLAKTAEKMQNKTPFSVWNVPYMDVWGNDEKNFDFGIGLPGRLLYNMLSPGYIEKKSDDKVGKMLMDLYDKTGETSVLPSNYTTHKKIDGENIRFTDKQFEKYTKEYGQTAYDRLDNLFSDKRFNSLTDKEKVKAIEDIYDYSREIASDETVEYELANTDKNKKAAIEIGVPTYDVFAGGTIADKDGNSNDAVTEAEAISYINKYGKSLTKEQKAVLYKVVGTDKGYTDAENKTYVNTYADIIKNISSGMSEAKVREIYENAHEYARAIAKVKAGVDDSTKTLENKEKALSAGVSPYYIFAGKQKADTLGNENGYTSKDEVISYIESLGLSSTEKAYLFAALGNSNWKNPYI